MHRVSFLSWVRRINSLLDCHSQTIIRIRGRDYRAHKKWWIIAEHGVLLTVKTVKDCCCHSEEDQLALHNIVLMMMNECMPGFLVCAKRREKRERNLNIKLNESEISIYHIIYYSSLGCWKEYIIDETIMSLLHLLIYYNLKIEVKKERDRKRNI
jgi:hypothetical protein